MKISQKTDFEPHPEYGGPAVCVDVTPPVLKQTAFGPKEVFRIVFETTERKQNGKPFLLFSRGFSPSLHEKSALRPFLKQWFGRDLTKQELEEFDTETLIGRSAKVIVVHNIGDKEEVYANIAHIKPALPQEELRPHGEYVRVKDRPADGSKDAKFAKVDRPVTGAGPETEDDWRSVKVHIGRHTGIEVSALDKASIEALIQHWLPGALQMAKPLKADRDLIRALNEAEKVLKAENDNIPY